MSELVSGQVAELKAEFTNSLAILNTLIENRGAWADGIEGCREAVALLTRSQERLQTLSDAAVSLEDKMNSARAELERWSKMHAELSTVERELRAESDLRRVALEEKSAGLSRARVLLRELTKELAS